MTTHELKLDVKYFNDVKLGFKNFEIRKNDRDFQVGDILEMRAWKPKNPYILTDIASYAFEHYDPIAYKIWGRCGINQADTITVKILNVVEADEYNSFRESIKGVLQSIKWANSYQETYIKTINEVLKDYFHIGQLPEGYVVLGIEVIE